MPVQVYATQAQSARISPVIQLMPLIPEFIVPEFVVHDDIVPVLVTIGVVSVGVVRVHPLSATVARMIPTIR